MARAVINDQVRSDRVGVEASGADGARSLRHERSGEQQLLEKSNARDQQLRDLRAEYLARGITDHGAVTDYVEQQLLDARETLYLVQLSYQELEQTLMRVKRKLALWSIAP